MKRNLLFRLLPAALVAALCAGTGACGDGEAAAGALPSDNQVITDVTPNNQDGLIDVSVTKGKRGEPYLHRNDLNWYWDRGVVIRRRANLEGAPDAVVAIGGLARYVLVGDRYQYSTFLTTYNEYEGIPAPGEAELIEFVEDNLSKVFVSRDHTITDVSSVSIADDVPWTWHSANSFSVPFFIAYKHKNSYTTLQARHALFDIRFYRDDIASPVNNLVATEKSRDVLGVEQFTADALDSMRTLRDGL